MFNYVFLINVLALFDYNITRINKNLKKPWQCVC